MGAAAHVFRPTGGPGPADVTGTRPSNPSARRTVLDPLPHSVLVFN